MCVARSTDLPLKALCKRPRTRAHTGYRVSVQLLSRRSMRLCSVAVELGQAACEVKLTARATACRRLSLWRPRELSYEGSNSGNPCNTANGADGRRTAKPMSADRERSLRWGVKAMGFPHKMEGYTTGNTERLRLPLKMMVVLPDPAQRSCDALPFLPGTTGTLSDLDGSSSEWMFGSTPPCEMTTWPSRRLSSSSLRIASWR